MANRTQPQQTLTPKQQAPAPVEYTGRGERGRNCCFFVGRLGADPTMRYTSSGIAVVTASLAVKSYPPATGPDWIKLRFWRGAAATISEYARRGSKLHIEGKLRVGRFTDQDGVARTTFVIDVDEFMFLSDSTHHASGVASAAGDLDEADLEGLDEIV